MGERGDKMKRGRKRKRAGKGKWGKEEQKMICFPFFHMRREGFSCRREGDKKNQGY